MRVIFFSHGRHGTNRRPSGKGGWNGFSETIRVEAETCAKMVSTMLDDEGEESGQDPWVEVIG
jgi:hypothetical protein